MRTIIADEAMPVSARVHAAGEICNIRPDLRGAMLRLLRGFRTTENPLVRVQVLEVIGEFDWVEAVPALYGLASDRACDPVVRLSAANTMRGLRRDYREKAAIVARDIAYDETAPHHVRFNAAQCLAWWSEICRMEARTLMIKLKTTWPTLDRRRRRS